MFIEYGILARLRLRLWRVSWRCFCGEVQCHRGFGYVQFVKKAQYKTILEHCGDAVKEPRRSDRSALHRTQHMCAVIAFVNKSEALSSAQRCETNSIVLIRVRWFGNTLPHTYYLCGRMSQQSSVIISIIDIDFYLCIRLLLIYAHRPQFVILT